MPSGNPQHSAARAILRSHEAIHNRTIWHGI
jgi:hypothetical protein